MTAAIKLIDATLHRTETETRMPFRFGIAVMTAAPHVFLQCRFEIDGTVVTGIAADGLLPKWFDKSPEKEAAQEIDEMLLVIRRAVGFAREVSAASAFDFWQQVYQAQVQWAAEEGFPSLLAQFGVSMVERTLLDALARAEGCPLATLLRERTTAVGQYVWDLPVSTLVSVKGGKGIWGMPKHQANLDFRVDDAEMSSQYDLDGELCMRITVRRPGGLKVPLRNFGAANYCQFRGMLMKSTIFFSDDVEVAAGSRAHAELILGPHKRMDPLRELDLAPSPLFVACLPHSHGILDDHYEGWFLTATDAPDPDRPPEGLESVVGLPNDQSRLPAPVAEGR